MVCFTLPGKDTLNVDDEVGQVAFQFLRLTSKAIVPGAESLFSPNTRVARNIVPNDE
jgi:hypothetical protein